MYKILNTHAGIGGNRKLWPDKYEITAVEHDPKIAEVYQDFYPNDTVVIGDANLYLLEHYDEFDFIWMSPPCPTHSQYRYNVGVKGKGFDPVLPDMSLYQAIIFLKHHSTGKWVVENVRPYYEPLIEPQVVNRHYFWANFNIPPIELPTTGIRSKNKISELEKYLGFDLNPYKLSNKRQILRNCVNSELGLHVMEAALSDVLRATEGGEEI